MSPLAKSANEEGIRFLLKRFRDELADTMGMCGAQSVSDITADMVWG